MQEQGLSTQDVLLAFSRNTDNVLMKVHYAEIDEKNHKSLFSLSHYLSSAGYAHLAHLLEIQMPYITFDNLKEALKTYELIKNYSRAISVQIFYHGAVAEEAEQAIHHKIDVIKPHIIHQDLIFVKKKSYHVAFHYQTEFKTITNGRPFETPVYSYSFHGQIPHHSLIVQS